MGANQSSSANGGNSGMKDSSEVKTCYYDLLGVERQVSDDEWVQPQLGHFLLA